MWTFCVHTCLVTLFILLSIFFIIFKCHCKVVYACLFRQWWGWLCCVDDVRYLTGSCSTGSKWPQSFTLFTVLFHVFYFFFYLVFCIIWLWRYFPIETVMFCIVLSVKPTPSLYQKYYFQCVSYAIFTMLQLLLCVSLLSTSISNDFHQHLRLFQHKYCWESNVALSPNKEDTGRLVRHVLFWRRCLCQLCRHPSLLPSAVQLWQTSVVKGRIGPPAVVLLWALSISK